MKKIKHFSELPRLEEDPILGLQILFDRDLRKEKVNLSIGVYKDDEGKLVLLDSISKAEKIILPKPKRYLPIDGDPEFNHLFLEFLWGSKSPVIESKRAFAVETLGGTGALSLMIELLKVQGYKEIAIPSPTWPNHILIVSKSNISIKTIPYYDQENSEIDKNFLPSLSNLDDETPLLLQVSCHNPTGVDLEEKHWKELLSLVKKKRLFPLFDLAYHGFKHSLREDLAPLKPFIEAKIPLAIAYSFSKNMGLYGDRVGALFVAAENEDGKLNALSQIKRLIRTTYSTPPIHGGELVKSLFKDDELKTMWFQELKKMKSRIQEMRVVFKKNLENENLHSLAHFEKTAGMFLLLDLSPEEVLSLRDRFAIYLPENGRINLAALTDKNMTYVVQSLKAIKSVS